MSEIDKSVPETLSTPLSTALWVTQILI